MVNFDWISLRRKLLWFPRLVDYALNRYVFRGSFRFRGEAYPYFCHWHGSTWRSERAVEVPIVWRIVQGSGDRNTLEIGNVLSNYLPVRHDVVDKYEMAHGVINEDAETFRAKKPYDLIVSISTMEHIGWNEEPRDPGKVIRCVDNLLRSLAAGGSMLFTVPLGYNTYLDKLLFGPGIKGARTFALRRVSIYRWEEADLADMKNIKYGVPWLNANGLAVVLIRK